MSFRRTRDMLKACLKPSRSIGLLRCDLRNFGDVMVFEAIREMLRDLTIVSYTGIGTKTRFLNSTVGLGRLFKYCGVGGGTLIFTPRNVGWLSTFEFLAKSSVPLFSFGTGVVDPDYIEQLDVRFDAAAAEDWITSLRRCPFISVRGVESKRILSEHGLADAEVVGDPALHFARSDYIKKPRRKRIGISLTRYAHFWRNQKSESLQKMEHVLKWLTEEKWQLVFFPAMAEDLEFCLEVVDRLGLYNAAIFDDFLDCRSVLNALETLDVFIGYRLHLGIAACCVCTPAIMIEYQPKCHDFMRTLNLDAYSFRADRLEVDELVGAITYAYEHAETIQQTQAFECSRYKKRLIDFRNRVVAHIVNCR